MDVRSRFDQILEMGTDEEVLKLRELAVVGILDYGDGVRRGGGCM